MALSCDTCAASRHSRSPLIRIRQKVTRGYIFYESSLAFRRKGFRMSNRGVFSAAGAAPVVSSLADSGSLKDAEDPAQKVQIETRFAAMAALMLCAAADPVQAAGLLDVVSNKDSDRSFALQDLILAEMDKVTWAEQSGSIAQAAAAAVSAARAAFEAGL